MTRRMGRKWSLHEHNLLVHSISATQTIDITIARSKLIDFYALLRLNGRSPTRRFPSIPRSTRSTARLAHWTIERTHSSPISTQTSERNDEMQETNANDPMPTNSPSGETRKARSARSLPSRVNERPVVRKPHPARHSTIHHSRATKTDHKSQFVRLVQVALLRSRTVRQRRRKRRARALSRKRNRCARADNTLVTTLKAVSRLSTMRTEVQRATTNTPLVELAPGPASLANELRLVRPRLNRDEQAAAKPT